MAPAFFADRRPHNGMTPAAYERMMAGKARQTDTSQLSETEKSHQAYTRLNYRRTLRIQKTYSVSPALEKALREIDSEQLWMVLTEEWCGDSAQTLPFLVKMAAVNPLITMRILPRDQNLDIMNQYLTNGNQAIPKLVAFDPDGTELFQWGPRPREAANLFGDARKAGIPKEEIYKKLHLWYGRNRGAALETEILERVRQLALQKDPAGASEIPGERPAL